MASFLPPVSPPVITNSVGQVDPEALAILIRQLKRSPESPSRLTLPPIMGIIEERDEDQEGGQGEEEDNDSDAGINISIEEVDDCLCEAGAETGSPDSSSYSYSSSSSSSSGFDNEYPHDLEDDRGGLWAIPEESEDMQSDDEIADQDGNPFGDENSPPVDRYSPPPPRPCINYLQSPTLPEVDNGVLQENDMSMIKTGLHLELQPCNDTERELEFTGAETDEPRLDDAEMSPCTETSEDPFRYISNEVPIPVQSIPDPTDTFNDNSCAPYPLFSYAGPQRRRRRTLSDLEQYRKMALTTAARRTQEEYLIAEESRQIREREEQIEREKDGLWIFFRRADRSARRTHMITRAQSYPPSSAPASSRAPAWYPPSSFSAEPIQEGISSRYTERDAFSSNWYDDEDDEVQHVEYAASAPAELQSCTLEPPSPSPSLSPLVPDAEEQMSPLTPMMETPRVLEGRGALFPSASQIFAHTGTHVDNISDLGAAVDGCLDIGLGVGLGLTGMGEKPNTEPVVEGNDSATATETTDSAAISNPDVVDENGDAEEGIVLRELPLSYIFRYTSKRQFKHSYGHGFEYEYEYNRSLDTVREYASRFHSDHLISVDQAMHQGDTKDETGPLITRDRTLERTISVPSSTQTSTLTLGLSTNPESQRIRVRSARRSDLRWTKERSRSESDYLARVPRPPTAEEVIVLSSKSSPSSCASDAGSREHGMGLENIARRKSCSDLKPQNPRVDHSSDVLAVLGDVFADDEDNQAGDDDQPHWAPAEHKSPSAIHYGRRKTRSAPPRSHTNHVDF